MKKILVAMSGGVDSAVTVGLLKEQGYTVGGATMLLRPGAEAEAEDARRAAETLDVPFWCFPLQKEFHTCVIAPFCRVYQTGGTPNPCVVCNNRLKFGLFLDKALELGYDAIATGHYARIEQDPGGRWLLKKAIHREKDQSYVLYMLSQDQLARTLFPLGELRKEAVRDLAEEAGLGNARKPDSQDICFVPDGDYARVIEHQTGHAAEPGDFVSPEGTVLGRHQGLIRYTVGQHRGLGLSLPERRYVCCLCPESNTVVLGPEEALYRREALAGDFHWIAGEPPAGPIRCRVKLRYRQRERDAEAVPLDGGDVRLRFDEPQRAVTPGQAAVLYDGDEVLGGGTLLRED